MWLVEARTVFRRARVLALLAVLGAIPVFLAVVVYISGGPAAGEARRSWTVSLTTGSSLRSLA